MTLKEEFKRIVELHKEGEYLFDLELNEFSKKLIDRKSEIPRLIRFSDANYDNIRSLETETLFLSPAGEMNDIFEGISCIIDDRVNHRIDELGDLVFLRSLTEYENINNQLMWAHYANKYKGLCVEYDFSKSEDAVLYHLFPVCYSNIKHVFKRIELTINDFSNLKSDFYNGYSPSDCEFINDILYMFLSKSECWEYEREWRIAASFPQINYRFEDYCDGDEGIEDMFLLNNQLIDVKGCIKAVYLGPRIEERKKQHIAEICKSDLCGVPVYESSIANDSYELIFSQLC